MGSKSSFEKEFIKKLREYPPNKMGCRQLENVRDYGVQRSYSSETMKPINDEFVRRKQLV